MPTYLGIDYGTARVGLAIARDSPLAVPWRTVNPQTLLAAITEQAPDHLVVGLPRNLDGNHTPQSAIVEAFVKTNLKVLGIPITLQDEAGTTSLAREQLTQAGRPFERADVDAQAAAIILQDYLDGRGVA